MRKSFAIFSIIARLSIILIFAAVLLPSKSVAKSTSLILPVHGTEMTRGILSLFGRKPEYRRMFRIDFGEMSSSKLGTPDEIFYSRDAGKTWTSVYTGLIETLYIPKDMPVEDVMPNLPRRVSVSRNTNYDLYRFAEFQRETLYFHSRGHLVMVHGLINTGLSSTGVSLPVKGVLGRESSFGVVRSSPFLEGSKEGFIVHNARYFEVFSVSTIDTGEQSGIFLTELGKQGPIIPLVNGFNGSEVMMRWAAAGKLYFPALDRTVDLDNLEQEALIAPMDVKRYESNVVDIRFELPLGTTYRRGGVLGNLMRVARDPELRAQFNSGDSTPASNGWTIDDYNSALGENMLRNIGCASYLKGNKQP